MLVIFNTSSEIAIVISDIFNCTIDELLVLQKTSFFWEVNITEQINFEDKKIVQRVKEVKGLLTCESVSAIQNKFHRNS